MSASTPPVSFQALAQTAANPSVGGYPYAIRGSDLDKNFTFATEDFNSDHFTLTTTLGAGGHQQRKVTLKTPIPTIPATGTHVLASVGGTLQWIATEEC